VLVFVKRTESLSRECLNPTALNRIGQPPPQSDCPTTQTRFVRIYNLPSLVAAILVPETLNFLYSSRSFEDRHPGSLKSLRLRGCRVMSNKILPSACSSNFGRFIPKTVSGLRLLV